MPKRKNIVTRISLEAREKLSKLSKEKGISNAKIIDRMLGTSSEQLEFQKSLHGTTLKKSQWWIKDVSEALRQKQSKEDTKPPKAVIDSAILCCWSPEEIALIEKDIPDPDDFRYRTRSDIHDYIRNKMVRKDEVTEESWSDYYPEWFKNHTDYMSAFKVTVDNRIKNLIARRILKKGTTKGTYQLNAELSKDEWATITGVDKLPAQKGLVISNLLSIEFVWDPKDKHDENT